MKKCSKCRFQVILHGEIKETKIVRSLFLVLKMSLNCNGNTYQAIFFYRVYMNCYTTSLKKYFQTVFQSNFTLGKLNHNIEKFINLKLKLFPGHAYL